MDIDKLERYRFAVSCTVETEESIKSDSRRSYLVRIRQMLMYFCKTELDMTLKEIGKLMGGRDHSTVIHGVNKFKDIISLKTKSNIEAKRYRYILKKYKEKYSDLIDNDYICVKSFIALLRVQLSELENLTKLTPIQEVVNNAKKVQLEKLINTIEYESSRKMDKRITHSGSTSKTI